MVFYMADESDRHKRRCKCHNKRHCRGKTGPTGSTGPTGKVGSTGGNSIEFVLSSLVIAISSVVGTASVTTAGTASEFMIRLIFLKIV